MARLKTTQNAGGITTELDTIVNNTPFLSNLNGPYTIGVWFNPSSSNSNSIWTLSNANPENATLTASTNFSFSGIDATGPNTFAIAGGSITTGAWHFALCREVNASNRWLSTLNVSTGTIVHTQDVTAMTYVSAPTIFQLGAATGVSNSTQTLDICEFWYLDSDVQSSTGQISDALFWNLAFYGPFSISGVKPNMVEYRSFRKDPFSPGSFSDTYSRSAIQVWQNGTGTASAPSIGPGPSLPGTYVRPGQVPRIRLV
jgi:hypothetical protein